MLQFESHLTLGYTTRRQKESDDCYRHVVQCRHSILLICISQTNTHSKDKTFHRYAYLLASFYCEYNDTDKPFLVNKKHYLGTYLICNE